METSQFDIREFAAGQSPGEPLGQLSVKGLLAQWVRLGASCGCPRVAAGVVCGFVVEVGGHVAMGRAGHRLVSAL